MFQALEQRKGISKAEFKQAQSTMHMDLLAAQRALRAANISTLIVVAGVEGAGKGAFVNRLNEWLDTRGVTTSAFWEESGEERERPRYWRFWRRMPARGSIAVLFGSWYTHPIIARVLKNNSKRDLKGELRRIVEFEKLLNDDGTLIIKLWFHLSEKEQKKLLKRDLAAGIAGKASPYLEEFNQYYERVLGIAEQVIQETDSERSPWHLIAAQDEYDRDYSGGQALLATMRERLALDPTATVKVARASQPDGGQNGGQTLGTVDLKSKCKVRVYRRELAKLQSKLRDLAWEAWQQRRTTIALFEGWDAAGKGGAIRRVTAGLDARLYRVISIAAPTDEEKARHYLWRFWRQVPGAGYMTIYDRSWYGRVLVERVERFSTEAEWMRAYAEINAFESQLAEHDILLCKYWIHIDRDEQLKRFREREKILWKHHKITAEDWRNRDKWEDYETAVNEMLARTSTKTAPWHVIAGNNKYYARLEVLKIFINALER